MDFAEMAAQFEGDGQALLNEWNERAAAVHAAAAAANEVPFTTDLPTILMKLLPLVLTLLSTGFTPAALLGLLPQILAVLFPTLDASLVETLVKIIGFFVDR